MNLFPVKKLIKEEIVLDIEVGDILLGGKFKNSRVEVKTIDTNNLGQPIINGKILLNFRIEKTLPDSKKSKKTLEGLKEEIEISIMKNNLNSLFESLFCEDDIDEATYPEGFSVDEFKAQTSFAARIRYVKEKFGMERLGSGSARIVFAIDTDTVMKIAKNKKGLAQNEVEVDVSNIGYDIVAKVHDYDENNYYFVEMERAKKMKKSDFTRIAGIRWDEFEEFIRYADIRRDPKMSGQDIRNFRPEIIDSLPDDSIVWEVEGLIADFGMPGGDIRRINSWGIVNRDGGEQAVLIDFGFTDTIDAEHYK